MRDGLALCIERVSWRNCEGRWAKYRGLSSGGPGRVSGAARDLDAPGGTVSQSSPTVLASGPITRSGDVVTVELIQPDSMPAAVRIVWPNGPTITTPARYNEPSRASA